MPPLPQSQSGHLYQPVHPPFLDMDDTNQHYYQYQYKRDSTSPFIAEIEQYKLPACNRLPRMKPYDGSMDPDDHIENYRWMMKAHYLYPRFWCTYFVTTLSGPVKSWFKSLSPRNIRDFEHMEEEFMAKFIQQRKLTYDPQALLVCQQHADETTEE